MSPSNTYGPHRNLSVQQWYQTVCAWPALVRAAYMALLDAWCAFGAAQRLAWGRRVRAEACGYSSDLCGLIVREQHRRARLAVRKAIYALALIRALHPKPRA